MNKMFYTDNIETIEFKIGKRKETYKKINKYSDVIQKATVCNEFFLNNYKIRILKSAVKMK